MNLQAFKNSQSPSTIYKSVVLGQIFFTEVVNDKKTYLLILVSVFPLLAVRTTSSAIPHTYVDLFSKGSLFSFIVLPIICLILGISAIANEKENKTISQLLTRPIKREEIVLLKWITILVTGILIACLDASIIFVGLCVIVQDFTIVFENFNILLGTWLLLSLWVAVYGTVFLFLGIMIDKNALGWGLAVAYSEIFLGQFIFGLATGNSPFSITSHLNFIAAEFFLQGYLDFQIPGFNPLYSLIICIVLIISFLSLSLIIMRRKDFP